jgi:hypothetical protein
MAVMITRFFLPQTDLESFCIRWKVTEMALFGSVLSTNFRPDSDIDILVTFAPKAHWSLFDLVSMQQELEELLGRPVDIVERGSLRNPFRRRSILANMEIVYAASGA